ncbi:MAG: helix-turn-helix domain-containing protein [Candidatus Dormibacteraeota bacterium]|nr:helix-turn-helix domain-containing protein [Candidatus Dormibacteraeota bacterium]
MISARCVLRAEGEHRLVVVAGLPVHHYSANDAVAEAYAMVFLVDAAYATQRQVATAFKCSERTVRRHQERYHDGGMAALATRSGWRPGRRRIPTKRVRVIERLKAEGVSNRDIARRLGVTENAIRKQVGPSEPRVEQQQLLLDGVAESSPVSDAGAGTPAETTSPQAPATARTVVAVTDAAAPAEATSPAQHAEPSLPTCEPPSMPSEGSVDEEAEPMAMSLDVDPGNRIWDRLLACFGLVDDAMPIFDDVKGVPGAGVLCAIPFLVASGIFRIAHKLYGEIGPAFYGTRTTLVTLLMMALGRIKRPEALKEHDPQALGRLLGLDRAPEVKTLRRKLTRLASHHKAERLGTELARLRVEERGQLMGFLYVDGHVRAYHGKRDIPKAHVARMRLAVPATTDYWVNDTSGDPLFVMTAPANAGMAKMLPKVLAEVRGLVGDRRVTMVFDRGGWSPQLFQRLLVANFDILTYRKGKTRRINQRRFVLRCAKIDGRSIEYRLHSQPVRFLKGKLRLRQVTRLTDDGHQTPIITSRWDLAEIEVAYRMFERWRQENFFKYLREEFLLDALVDYQVEPDDPTRTVPSPERHALDTEIRAARAQVAELEQAYGAAAADNPERRRPTMRGFKIAHGKIGKHLRETRDCLAELLTRRRALPERVEVQDVSVGAVVKLATERKHLTNLIKMVAYQAESDLLALLSPHYARSDDEGRTLLHEIFRTAADIAVADGELRVTLHPLSSPHRTLAVGTLCEALSATATVFPGSRLRMRLSIQPAPQIGLAFPGPRASKPAPSQHART